MNFDRSNYILQPSPISKELKLLFNQKEPIIIFEIGSCEGEDSIKYSRIFPNSKIYAFEPLPKNVEHIKKNIINYKVSNISLIDKALSDANGTASFFVSAGQPDGHKNADWDFGNKSSSLLPPDKHLDLVGFLKFNEKIEIETITLDTFCFENEIKTIDFVHMDVQGAELKVLIGAKETLKFIKAIWLEVSNIQLYKGQPITSEIFDFMTRNNFVLVKDAVGAITGDQMYVNITFYPKAKFLFFNNLLRIRLRKIKQSLKSLFHVGHNIIKQ